MFVVVVVVVVFVVVVLAVRGWGWGLVAEEAEIIKHPFGDREGKLQLVQTAVKNCS